MWKVLDAQIWTTLGSFAWRVMVAALVVIVGIWLVNRITRIVHRVLTDKKIDPTIVHFAESAFKVILFGIVFIEAIHKLGVESSSLIALVGAAGFAMKAHLGNVAKRLTRQLVIESLKRSVSINRPNANLIHHSDRGTQYCSYDYRHMLRQY